MPTTPESYDSLVADAANELAEMMTEAGVDQHTVMTIMRQVSEIMQELRASTSSESVDNGRARRSLADAIDGMLE